jgi:phosphate transport system protein
VATRKHYGDRIEELKYSVVRMAGLLEEAVGKATQAFVQGNAELARQVIEGDKQIDAMEDQVAEQCTDLIATEQPVASDLRLIVAALSISNDMERIGDYAAHLATVATRLSRELVSMSRAEIAGMSEIAISMIRDAARAFLEQNCGLAIEVKRRDDQVDGLYARFFQEVLQDMAEHKDHIQEAAALLFCSKYLERLADHATNVCEEVIYVCTGRKYID